MLRNRIITAVILIPLVVAAILLLPSPWFAILIGFFLLLGSKEMAQLSNIKSPVLIGLYGLCFVIALLGIYFLLAAKWQVVLQIFAVLWWLAISVALLTRGKPVEAVGGKRLGILLLGGLVLLVAWLSVLNLHRQSENGPALVMFLFVLIWVAESGAYFAGRAWGKTKLSQFVSPGKTQAGAMGAMAGALVCAFGLWFSGLLSVSLIGLVLLCLLVTAVSIGGDLWESLLKRQAQVKDSGTLLPGHGGVLDRLDSLLAAAPVFVIGLDVLEALA